MKRLLVPALLSPVLLLQDKASGDKVQLAVFSLQHTVPWLFYK